MRQRLLQSQLGQQRSEEKSFHDLFLFGFYLGDPVLMTTQASNMGPSDVPPWGWVKSYRHEL